MKSHKERMQLLSLTTCSINLHESCLPKERKQILEMQTEAIKGPADCQTKEEEEEGEIFDT